MTDKLATDPITSLLAEIKDFDASLFPPVQEVSEHDDIVGVCPEELRRFFSYARFCERERKQLMVEMEFDSEKDPTKEARLWQLAKRHDIALALFYFCIWEHFEAYENDIALGVRKDWKVSLTKIERGGMPPFLRHLFGGGE